MDLIPYHALVRLAARYELGWEKHGRNNWRQGITDHEYVLERASHVMNHCALLIAKLQGFVEEDGDDDAAAIAWGGMFLCEATEAVRKVKNCSACGGVGMIGTNPADPDWHTCPACSGRGKAK